MTYNEYRINAISHTLIVFNDYYYCYLKITGKYVLVVSSDRNVVAFEYNVSVIGPPEVIRPSPPVVLVMEGNNVTFSTEINSFISSVSSNWFLFDKSTNICYILFSFVSFHQ